MIEICRAGAANKIVLGLIMILVACWPDRAGVVAEEPPMEDFLKAELGYMLETPSPQKIHSIYKNPKSVMFAKVALTSACKRLS